MKSRMRFLLFFSQILFILIATSAFAFNDHRSVISNPSVTFSDTAFTFSYKVTSAQSFYRVYIDTTQDPSTGYYVGQIGAKFLLENGFLYSYVGPGWKWKQVNTTVTFTNENDTVTWSIARDAMGSMDCAGAFDYALQVQTGNNIYTVPKATLTYTADPSCSTPPPPPTTAQQLAIPSYFDPCGTSSSCGWNVLDAQIPKVGIAIINPNSGPGSSSQSDYVTQVKTTQSLGGIVIGYVDTNYGANSLSSVEAQVDSYYSWYNVDGIFFDNGNNVCSSLSYYEALNTYVKAKGGKGLTAVNYGTDVPECMISASDILVNFEDVYSNYVNWTPLSWYASYPATRFWQISIDTPEADVANAVQLANKRNAAYVFVTNLNTPNPYGSLPSTAVWDAELAALATSLR